MSPENSAMIQPLSLNESEKIELQLLELQERFGQLSEAERDRLKQFKFLREQPMAPGMPVSAPSAPAPRPVNPHDFRNPKRKLKSKFTVR
jgi:hypothetical protein